jgi:CubicO group peptidase (beta-lactamase class C family)
VAYSIGWTESAISSVAEASEYIAKDSPSYAAALIAKATPLRQLVDVWRETIPGMRLKHLGIAIALLPLFAHAGEKTIRRLDGTHISVEAASKLARETFATQHVTGAQIAVVDRGQLVWSEVFGMRSLDPPLPMERTTTTWAASITKSVFATYVMQLVERGEFDLDLPVARQLPKPLDQYEPYRDTASALVADPQWLRITPRMLLAHSSGLHNFAIFEPDKKMHIHFAPGTQFFYSGDGINLLQFLIEQKKQRPLDALMQEALFAPLGMSRTGMIFRKDFESDIADRFDAEGKFKAKTRRNPARAAGSMTSTAEDLARFASALFAGKIVKASTRKAMFAPAIAIRTLHQFALAAGEPESAEGPEVGLAYGAGWGLLTRTRFGPAFFKEGHGDGAQNYMICFERRQACMILLTNSDNGELSFRALFEGILGDTVTPWEWEGYTPGYIATSRKNGN